MCSLQNNLNVLYWEHNKPLKHNVSTFKKNCFGKVSLSDLQCTENTMLAIVGTQQMPKIE